MFTFSELISPQAVSSYLSTVYDYSRCIAEQPSEMLLISSIFTRRCALPASLTTTTPSLLRLTLQSRVGQEPIQSREHFLTRHSQRGDLVSRSRRLLTINLTMKQRYDLACSPLVSSSGWDIFRTCLVPFISQSLSLRPFRLFPSRRNPNKDALAYFRSVNYYREAQPRSYPYPLFRIGFLIPAVL